MEEKKDGFNDFFKNDEHKEAEPKQEKPSYYYSYGPYKSVEAEDRNHEQTNGLQAEAEITEVGITSPPPLRPFGLPQDKREETNVKPAWATREPRRRSGKSFFAGFLAAAVVMASLMFYADKTNLFTGDQVLLGINPATTTAAAGNGGIVKAVDVAGGDVVRPNTIAQIVQNSSPAVVKIETSVKTQARSSRGGSIFDDPTFKQFFGDDTPSQPDPSANDGSANAPLTPLGLGSGFIFEKSGYILTNEHVIDGADDIQVTVQGYDKPFTAKLLGSSYDLDLAVLKIVGTKDFPSLSLSTTADTAVGDWVVAIGNPYGFDHTVTVGVFSAQDREISIPDQEGTRDYKHLIQTDASINPGNSGGPLLNLNGEVIGINTAVSSQAQGIGFAIPASTITGVLTNLVNNVAIPKPPAPFINATVGPISDSLLQDLQLTSTDGALVMAVPIGGPAFKGGLKTNDAVVGVDGTPIKTNQDLIDKIHAKKPGDKITLNIVRDGAKMDIVITIGDMNTDANYQKQLKEQQQEQQQQEQQQLP